MSPRNEIALNEMSSPNTFLDTNVAAKASTMKESSDPLQPAPSTATPMKREIIDTDSFLQVTVEFQLAVDTFHPMSTTIPIEHILSGNQYAHHDFMRHIGGAILTASRQFPKCDARDRSIIRELVHYNDYNISCNKIRHGRLVNELLHTPNQVEKYLLQQCNHIDTNSHMDSFIQLFIRFPADFIIGNHQRDSSLHFPLPSSSPMPTGYTEIAGSAPSPKPGVLSINDFMGMHIFDRNDYIERLLSKSKMVDLKNFLKKEYIPRKLAGMSWTMWYKRFTMHALIHGIYVPPYESLIKGSIMGAWFDDLPEAFQERKLSWSYRIIQVLTNQHTIPDGPELTTLQRFESGYAALHHIMYSHHPRLTYNSSNEIVPTQKCGETVPSYIARWTEFLIFQHVMGTPWAPIRAVECIINNLPSPHNTWIHSQFQLECYVFSNDKSILPPAYTMGQIAKTIEDLMNTNPYQHFDDSPAIEDDDDITPQNR